MPLEEGCVKACMLMEGEILEQKDKLVGAGMEGKLAGVELEQEDILGVVAVSILEVVEVEVEVVADILEGEAVAEEVVASILEGEVAEYILEGEAECSILVEEVVDNILEEMECV